MFGVRVTTSIVTALLVVVSLGCQPGLSTGGAGGDCFPYGPTQFRVHSLSRFEGDSEGERNALELWIEFLDADGETTRGIGHLQANVVVPGRQPIVAAMNLDDRAVNSEAWDSPLRMYRLKLAIKPPLPADPAPTARVTVTWTAPDGGRKIINMAIGGK